MTIKTKVLWPDTHFHYENPLAVAHLIDYIAGTQPAEVCILGDFVDCKAPARWSRGTADEFAADLEVEAAAANVALERLRSVYDGPITFLFGNHENRLERYALTHAPALRGLVREIPELLGLPELGVCVMQQPYHIAPGVVAIHGNKLSKHATRSAYAEQQRHGFSIVQGHSHRLGVAWETTDRTRFAMECGWLGDVTKADYLEFHGVANWQLGFGELRIMGEKVQPYPVHIFDDGTFL